MCVCIYIYIYIYIYTYQSFIHSAVNRHLGCFQVLAIMNSAAINIGHMYTFELEFSLDTSQFFIPLVKSGMMVIPCSSQPCLNSSLDHVKGWMC